MKCLILAGGKGNSLWPLSREEYPKQFMQVKRNRSLLQETVARNIPFCDEFLIATNVSYHFIVEGQLSVFQGLRYRCILEEEGRKTGPAVALACMSLNPSELVYVVSADQIIEGSDYKETIMRGRTLAKAGRLVTFGMEALSPHTGYGYIRSDGDRVLEFKEKPDQETAKRYFDSGEYMWNSGNFLFCAGDFLNELKKAAPDLYQACKSAHRRLVRTGSVVRLPAELMQTIPSVSVENAVFEHSDCVCVVKAAFHWWDIGNLEILSSYMKENEEKNTIAEHCENLTVINRTERQLIVANDVKDITVINTEDACYITRYGSELSIKQVMQKHPEHRAYFEKSETMYRPWGFYVVLNYSANYKVKKVTVYPGKALTMHRHAMRSEQWSVVEGTATVTLDGREQELPLYRSIEVPVGVSHMLSNKTERDLVVMEVSFGPQITEDDKDNVVVSPAKRKIEEEFILCEPAFKDYLWGGTKLRDIYGKDCDYDKIAESWELSAHEAGQCRVGSGKYQGMLFSEYLDLIGEDALGWKCQAFEKFPLLIKFIDAKEQLSVQVHPDDSYALPNENEYGKSEMWYVMDCDADASIYFGVKQDISAEELERRTENNTITEVLNRVPVHRGDTFFVEAGTIHAIGRGVLICEIQQNSNCTYRLYDYGRRDKFGNLRELQADKAVAVSKTACQEPPGQGYPLESQPGCAVQKLCECKYFTSTRYDIKESAEIPMDETSFAAVVILEGAGWIQVNENRMPFKAADCFFVHAGRKYIGLTGTCSAILTRL